MAEVIPPVLTGWLLPDPRIIPANIDSASSSYTEAGPRPGEAVPQQATSLSIIPSGSQPSGVVDEIRLVRGGFPGAAAFVSRRTGESAWYGCDLPVVPHGFFVGRQYATGAGNSAVRPSIIALDYQTALVAWRDGGAVKCAKLTAGSLAGSDTTIAASGASSPVLLRLASGRILCIAGSIYASNDDGTTWSLYSRQVIDMGDRAAVAVDEVTGAILLSVNTGATTRVQWASTDLGQTFELVETATVSSGVTVGVVAAVGGGFVCVNDTSAVRLGTPYDRISQQPTIALGHTFGFSVPVVDPAGAIWVMDGNAYEGQLARSTDNGATWEVQTFLSTDTFWWAMDSATCRPINTSAAWVGDGAVLVFNAEYGATATAHPDYTGYADSLFVATQGGASTITAAQLSDTPTVIQYGLEKSWRGVELPQVCGWSRTGSPSFEGLASTGQYSVQTTSGNNRYQFLTGGGNGTRSFRVTAAVTSGRFSVGIGTTSGANQIDIEMRMTSTGITVEDIGNASTLAGTVTGLTGGTEYEVLFVLEGFTVWAWYRVWTADARHTWTQWVNGESVNTPAGSHADFRWGRIDTVGDSDWSVRELHLLDGTYLPDPSDWSLPNDLVGRPLSGSPGHVRGGLYVSASSGPGVLADEWKVSTEYEHPIANLHVLDQPSRSVTHRTTSTTPPQVAWTFTTGTADGETGEAPLWAWYGDNISFRNVRFEYQDGVGGSWVTIATSDLGLSFTGKRVGSTVLPATTGSTAAGAYVERDELVNALLEFSSGECVRILRNTGGYLTSGSAINEPRAVLYLDPSQMDDAEDVSGTFVIRPKRAAVVMHDPFSGNAVGGFRVTVAPAGENAPPEGYYETGVWAIGPVVAFGTEAEPQRRRRFAFNGDRATDRTGRRARIQRGEPREIRESSWTNGIDTTFTRGETQPIDYVRGTSTSGGRPVSARRDTPLDIIGAYRETDARGMLVVDLPYIPTGTPDVVVLNTQRARGALLCRLGEELSTEALLGNPERGELVRVSVELEEEL